MEEGSSLAESKRFEAETQIIVSDIDVQKINFDRRSSSSFRDSFDCYKKFNLIQFQSSQDVATHKNLEVKRFNSPHPFIPDNAHKKNEVCEEIFAIQSAGLAKRLRHLELKKVIIGISGGLDSTLALLVCIKAFELLKLDSKGIVAVTMPGFGTSDRTKSNALDLIDLIGAKSRTISITSSVGQHFSDIGHNPLVHDVVYENSQARERTQILMNIANMENGIVVGTGDLSELALGWCTFNGDHMSMYNVNAGVPKTLVRYVIEWCAQNKHEGEIARVLRDICNTPVSPELLPLDAAGQITQITEDLVGPYELHDYFLYGFIRCGYSPQKILYLACLAFKGVFDEDAISHWLSVFIKRFFSQQYKRSSMPDGPKVGSIALSPRGDWRMPSDAYSGLWADDFLPNAGH
jgi:NAD+ synthase (glutamine-hydrolysing)